MFKLIFKLLTDPLGLPIPAIYEYIVIFILGLIASKIAWETSPGGSMGSAIYWIVILSAFVVMWFIAYSLIILAKWIISNWFVLLAVIFGTSLLFIIGYTLINKER